MFGISKSKSKGTEVTLQVEGMHCSSCAMSIDNELEDTDGVFSADTSYAKSQTNIHFDPEKINTVEITEIIAKLGYSSKPKS